MQALRVYSRHIHLINLDASSKTRLDQIFNISDKGKGLMVNSEEEATINMEIREGRIFQEAESCIIDLLASSSFPAFLKGPYCSELKTTLVQQEPQIEQLLNPFRSFNKTTTDAVSGYTRRAVQAGLFALAEHIWQEGMQLFASFHPDHPPPRLATPSGGSVVKRPFFTSRNRESKPRTYHVSPASPVQRARYGTIPSALDDDDEVSHSRAVVKTAFAIRVQHGPRHAMPSGESVLGSRHDSDVEMGRFHDPMSVSRAGGSTLGSTLGRDGEEKMTSRAHFHLTAEEAFLETCQSDLKDLRRLEGGELNRTEELLGPLAVKMEKELQRWVRLMLEEVYGRSDPGPARGRTKNVSGDGSLDASQGVSLTPAVEHPGTGSLPVTSPLIVTPLLRLELVRRLDELIKRAHIAHNQLLDRIAETQPWILPARSKSNRVDMLVRSAVVQRQTSSSRVGVTRPTVFTSNRGHAATPPGVASPGSARQR